MSIRIASPAVIAESLGRTATSEWLLIDQERITAFAEVTEDWQWIHTDPERAAAGPFGGTVAHGYLTLSLISGLTEGLIDVADTAMVVNYGLDRVRFIQPVLSGSRVRASVELVSVQETRQGYRAGSTVTIEIEGTERPALVAETIALYVPA